MTIHPSTIYTTYPLRVTGDAGANPEVTMYHRDKQTIHFHIHTHDQFRVSNQTYPRSARLWTVGGTRLTIENTNRLWANMQRPRLNRNSIWEPSGTVLTTAPAHRLWLVLWISFTPSADSQRVVAGMVYFKRRMLPFVIVVLNTAVVKEEIELRSRPAAVLSLSFPSAWSGTHCAPTNRGSESHVTLGRQPLPEPSIMDSLCWRSAVM